jgi:hypothetical protein
MFTPQEIDTAQFKKKGQIDAQRKEESNIHVDRFEERTT